MTTPGIRLKLARERSGYDTAKDAALAMGVPIATYTQHEKSVKHLPARRADEYAKFFGLTPEYLQFGRGDIPARVPILDHFGQDTGQTAALPAPPSGLTAAIHGDGIAYFDFVAIYDRPQSGRPSPDCHGRLCVVETMLEMGDNRPVRLVRIVQRGSTPERFHLIGPGLPLFDHKVLWIAPVTALIPT